MIEKLIDIFLDAMEENDYMFNHEKQKVKEANRVIKQLIKVNESIENKVDVAPYIMEREEHLKQLSEHKQIQRKLYRMYKILIKDSEE